MMPNKLFQNNFPARKTVFVPSLLLLNYFFQQRKKAKLENVSSHYETENHSAIRENNQQHPFR